MAVPAHTHSKFTKQAVMLLVLAFIFISLFTYDPADSSFFTSNPNTPPLNRAGRLGALISTYLLYLPFGLAAWIAPVIIALWAGGSGQSSGAGPAARKAAGGLAALFSAAGCFAISGVDSSWGGFPPGGMAGTSISRILTPWFGGWGTFIILAGLFIIGFFQATELSAVSLGRSLLKISAGAARALGNVSCLFARKAKNALKSVFKERESSGPAPEKQPRAPAAAAEAPRRKRRAAPPVKEPAPPRAAGNGRKTPDDFRLPNLNLLNPPPPAGKDADEDINNKISSLEDALQSYGVECKVVNVNRGPIISSFEIEPARGVKLNQITSLADDIALVMKTQSVRISPIQGKSVIGVEVPNKHPRFVCLREILQSGAFRKAPPPLALGLGTDILGSPLIANLSEMPHLLVAGTTGSGKTICLNSIILSMLFNASPDEVKFMMIDPKRVELTVFEGLPHLITPVVTNVKKAARSLKWVVEEMDNRYSVLSKAGVRNIHSLNKIAGSEEERMPHIIVVIDELHDLMMVAQASVEDIITRLAQLSRAVGIHLVIATQRPSVDVITGVIKANLPCRISFQVSSKVDSRTILDANGAEKLIGKGDMLFLPPGKGSLVRAQCALVTDEETQRVVSFLRAQRQPEYGVEISEGDGGEERPGPDSDSADDDELYEEALTVVLRAGKGSTSLLQRRLNIGYGRAARLLDRMESQGIISAARGTRPRTVLKGKNEGEEA